MALITNLIDPTSSSQENESILGKPKSRAPRLRNLVLQRQTLSLGRATLNRLHLQIAHFNHFYSTHTPHITALTHQSQIIQQARLLRRHVAHAEFKLGFRNKKSYAIVLKTIEKINRVQQERVSKYYSTATSQLPDKICDIKTTLEKTKFDLEGCGKIILQQDTDAFRKACADALKKGEMGMTEINRSRWSRAQLLIGFHDLQLVEISLEFEMGFLSWEDFLKLDEFGEQVKSKHLAQSGEILQIVRS